MKVLVINAGSSSLKYQLMDPETGKVFAKGLCERIGLDGKFTYKPQVEGKETIKAADVAMPTHSEAIQTVLNALVDPQNGVISSMKEIDAVGHRVVHGGETFASSVLINDEVLKAVEDCTPLAPLHNPANIIGIEACRKVLGDDVPQVAVFDTAFHQTMPERLFRPSITEEMERSYLLATYSITPTSMSPARVPMGRPASGVRPMEVSTHLPPSTAAREEPLPRWQDTIFRSLGSLPSSSAARRVT